MLVDKKINIDETNKDGDTAMMLAVRLENIEAVEILIKNKASIKNKNKNHETVMDVAKSNFYIKNILDIYIKEINKKEELIERFIFEIKETKFFKSNETKIPNLKKMIAEGVDINSVNKYKNYPIITAIDSNNFEIIKFLLENGADVNVQNTAGETAITRSLLQAHMSGCYDSEAYKIVEFLLKNGANPNFLPKVVEISQNTNTPLIQAVSYKNRYLVKLLIQYGADVNQESADDLIAKWTTTPLITSIGDFKMFRYLVKKGAKINKINRNGDNPLIYAAINCKTKYLSLLINSGESCSVKNKELSTPIMESLRHSDPDYRDFYKTAKQWRFYRYQTITKLVRHGCDINAKNIYGNSALNIACYHGFLDIIEFLIKQGSKVNLQDNNGNTPLHSAVLSSNDCSIESKFKYIKIIYILYKYGADTHIKNNENKIPINLVNKNNIEILNILLRITKKEESGFLKFKFF
jgi:ankyrin repeat protein